ncbi:MAG: peptide MFS transporter [Bacteroidales bacterium]|jgi:POT family proton-dependent oligopeptide transporter|nr:peptide MFS transporter [Bacteroidales bacterium]
MYKQPKSLAFLFFTEMWERFSFYGMRALLTLYLTLQLFRHLQEPEKKAAAFGIYAAYGALVYATPFIGGLIADKFLGYKKAIIWGAILMAVGHFVMAIESEFFLYLALAFLIIGNGFFKPNISSIVGNLYMENDPRRDSGFTIFYMGVNLGAFFSPLICGIIGETFGWHWGFGIAGLGMIIGLVVFMRNQKNLDHKESIDFNNPSAEVQIVPAQIGAPPHVEELQKKRFFGISIEHCIYALSVASVAVFALLVKNYQFMTYALTPFAVAVVLIIFVIAVRSPKVERQRLFVILILLFFTVLFFAFFEQAGSSLTLFANENVNRNLFSFTVPTSLFQSVNPLFILVLATPLTMLWLRLAERKREPNTVVKFSLGLFFLSLGFLLLAVAPYFVRAVSLNVGGIDTPLVLHIAAVPMLILIVSYMLQTIGELCLSPIGLSMVTKLSPPRITAMVMGAWFLSSAMAHHVAGIIANFTTQEESPVEIMISDFAEHLPAQSLTLSAEEFFAAHTNEISETYYTAFNDILSEKPLKAVYERAWGNFKQTNLTQFIQDSALVSQAMLHSFNTGLAHFYEQGEHAVLQAADKRFISEARADTLSPSTKYSLFNLLNYARVFGVVGLIALVASLVLFALSPFITRMMHEN